MSEFEGVSTLKSNEEFREWEVQLSRQRLRRAALRWFLESSAEQHENYTEAVAYADEEIDDEALALVRLLGHHVDPVLNTDRLSREVHAAIAALNDELLDAGTEVPILAPQYRWRIEELIIQKAKKAFWSATESKDCVGA